MHEAIDEDIPKSMPTAMFLAVPNKTCWYELLRRMWRSKELSIQNGSRFAILKKSVLPP